MKGVSPVFVIRRRFEERGGISERDREHLREREREREREA